MRHWNSQAAVIWMQGSQHTAGEKKQQLFYGLTGHSHTHMAIALVGAAHKSIASATVVAASNLWSRIALYDCGGLCDVIHISSNAKKVQNDTL
eukprot:scaffold13791_cov36-Cyclotella_meneghiniana.AAC.3